MQYLIIKNHQAVPLTEIPVLPGDLFYEVNCGLMLENSARHCVNFFGYRQADGIMLICCIADDINHKIYVTSMLAHQGDLLSSMSVKHLGFEKFEREIHENFGIGFKDHPWLKPVRYPADRFNPTDSIGNYPFFKIHSEELHEVGVGPIHAGIIEPGYFRFICDGEKILHLEIQLGYQHRGIEKLFLQKKRLNQQAALAETIAGDTVVGHGLAFAQNIESLSGTQVSQQVLIARTIALELERIAIHTGDLSALCTDVAYQLGSAVFSRLRTPIVNFMQEWCGNRLSKGLIRPGRMSYPFTPQLAIRLREVLDQYEPDFLEMCRQLFQLPSALSRFERTGVVSIEDTLAVGAVGMAARMAGVNRDIRSSHPSLGYRELLHTPVIKHHGDVFSRVQIRKEEIIQSMGYIRHSLKMIEEPETDTKSDLQPQAGMFVLSLVEGWRGEICHVAITDQQGELALYKIKDPSFHNWLMLSLAVRNNEISDFPICNKSFNLSYCGHDL